MLQSGELDLPTILPGQSSLLDLPKNLHPYSHPAEIYLTISLRLRDATAWADAFHEVAWFQHQVSAPKSLLLSQSSNRLLIRPLVESSHTALSVTGHDWTIRFDRIRGYLTTWVAGGAPLLGSDSSTRPAMVPGFWRPPTDNDYPVALPYWKNYGLEAMTSQLQSFHEDPCAEGSDSVGVHAHTFMAPPSLDWGYHVFTTYTISPSGSIAVRAKFQPTGSMPKHVPRIGFDVQVNKQLQEARWFGLGPGEAYPDKKDAQSVGIWAVPTIADLQTRYDVPQENGNRMETRWVTMTSTSGVGLRASSTTPFNWQASRYSSKTIENAKHPCDFIGQEEKTTLLRLDCQVAGVGTAACGPGPREDMLVHTKAEEFQFQLERIIL